MAHAIYAGVQGKACRVTSIYYGVQNKACKVKKVYVGIGGKAALVWDADEQAAQANETKAKEE